MTKEQVIEIWEKYPKAARELVEWSKSQTKLTGISEIDVHVSKILENMEDTTKMVLVSAPYIVYDFFDLKGLRIGIMPVDDKFYWTVKYKQGDNPLSPTSIGNSTTNNNSRKEAESGAIICAFEILNSKL
jgi:hypothetical protein